MILSLIAALDERRGIGIGNQLPWHMPGDLRRFKMVTMGHHLILGRKTYQSIGKPLPGRKMIVLSRNPEFRLGDGQVVTTLEDALQVARDAGESEVFVSGGAEIYQQALPLVEKMYLTRIHTISKADVFFPDFDPENWLKICEQTYSEDQDNPFRYTFTYLIRKIFP
jgi:dihydrofolate reductase